MRPRRRRGVGRADYEVCWHPKDGVGYPLICNRDAAVEAWVGDKLIYVCREHAKLYPKEAGR